MEHQKIIIVNKNVASFSPGSGDTAYFTSSAAEAGGILLDTRPRIIEFVGGDGTFSASLNEALLKDPGFLEDRWIKIHPRGTGNDRVKSLQEISKTLLKKNDVRQHITGLKPGQKLFCDDYLLVTINGTLKRYVFNIGGIGLDSQTLIEYEDMRGVAVPSSLKYFGAATKAIHRLNGYKGLVNYRYGSHPVDTAEPVMFLFMLGKYFGGGMPINRKLVYNDGKFESVILNRGTNIKLYRSLAEISLLKLSQYHNPIVKYLAPVSMADLEVMSADKFYFESDGEVLHNGGKPVEVTHIRVEAAGKINYLIG